MNRNFNIAIPLLVFLFIAAILPELPGMEFDIRGGFQVWALHIYHNGLRNAYGVTDYMPVFQYILWVYVKLTGNDQSIIDHMPYLRLFTLAFDFLGLWYLYRWIDKKIAFYAIIAICVLNIGYSYDTLIWGQVDGILSALVFITFYYAWKGNNLLSALALVLAFNFKVQAIVIVPLWGLLFINNFLTTHSWKDIVLPVGAAAVLQAAIFFPFTLGHYGVKDIMATVTGSFNKFQSISIKAGNMWHWFVKGTLIYKSDADVWFAGLTYKQVGLLLFFTASFFALLPLLRIVLRRLRNPAAAPMPSRQLIWVTAALLYMLFYFLNTEIHERYCQPAFIFIAAYSFFSNDYKAFILFSIMYFLTLEVSLGHLRLHNYETMIFDFRFLAALNALIIIYLYTKLYGSAGKPELPAATIPQTA